MGLPAKQPHPMTKEQALEAIREGYPDAYNTLLAVVNKNVLTLGTDEAFAMTDKGGAIRAFKQRLTLSAQNGGLVQPVSNGPFTVSAQGYEMWAVEKGASVIFPKEVLVGGQWQKNPFVEKDPENRRTLAIYARAIAFCYSSKGIPLVVDWTTSFDVPAYRMIDLLAKAKSTPQAFKLLPKEAGKPEEEGAWGGYHFDEVMTLWVNAAHEEAITWYSQIMNREKKALDFAQTFARRNSLKHLSGIQKVPGQERLKKIDVPAKGGKKAYSFYKTIVTPINQWDIPILCWRPTGNNIIKWDAAQYDQLQNRVAGMISGDTSDFESEPPPQISYGSETLEAPEDLESEMDQEDKAEEEGGEASPEPAGSDQPGPTLSEEDQKILANYEASRDDAVLKGHFESALAHVKPADPNNPTPAEAQAVLEKMNSCL